MAEENAQEEKNVPKEPAEKTQQKKQPKKAKKPPQARISLLLFNRWDTGGIEIADRSIEPYIGLRPALVPRSYGRHAGKQFRKSQIHIVERLMNKMMVPGHRSKKHLITSGRNVGKSEQRYAQMRQILSKIEERTKQNPVHVLVKAIENAALCEEITSYQMGGMMVRKAVVTSPQRRVDWALKLMAQSAFQKAFNNKKTIVDAMVDEIIACYQNNVQNSNTIRERERIEREAEGAR